MMTWAAVQWMRVLTMIDGMFCGSIRTAFECFRLIMECKNIWRNNLNKLLNSRIKDDGHIIKTCMENSIVNNSFTKYLIENNGKKDGKLIVKKAMLSSWHA